MVYYIAQMKHLYNPQVTVHGLDTGIPAGMTVIFARKRENWIHSTPSTKSNNRPKRWRISP